MRVLPSSEVEVWHESPEPDDEELVRRAFRIDGERPDEEQRVSTYLARSARQEALAVAARYRTFGRKGLQDTWALRVEIERGLLPRWLATTPPRGRAETGVGFDDEEPGRTGVPTVDALHRDVLGSRHAFVALARRLHGALLAGEDRLRHVGKGYLDRCLRTFVDDPSGRDDAKGAFRRALGLPPS